MQSSDSVSHVHNVLKMDEDQCDARTALREPGTHLQSVRLLRRYQVSQVGGGLRGLHSAQVDICSLGWGGFLWAIFSAAPLVCAQLASEGEEQRLCSFTVTCLLCGHAACGVSVCCFLSFPCETSASFYTTISDDHRDLRHTLGYTVKCAWGSCETIAQFPIEK